MKVYAQRPKQPQQLASLNITRLSTNLWQVIQFVHSCSCNARLEIMLSNSCSMLRLRVSKCVLITPRQLASLMIPQYCVLQSSSQASSQTQGQ